MIVGLGIDVAPVDRIRGALERHGERLIAKLFRPGEIRRKPEPAGPYAEHVAGRFAAKEAAMKALGTGWNAGVGWKSIEVVREPSGKPALRFHDGAASCARELGADAVHLTITHGGGVAVAVVVLEKSGG